MPCYNCPPEFVIELDKKCTILFLYQGFPTWGTCTPRAVVPYLFYAVAHLSLSAERRGPLSQNNRKSYSKSSFKYKYEQTK